MPIDDKLGELEETEGEKEEEKPVVDKDYTDVFQILESFPQTIHNKLTKQSFTPGFNVDFVKKFSKYIKFGQSLDVHIKVPKKELIEIINTLSTSLACLLAETDLGDYIPPVFFPASVDAYKKIPDYLNMKNTLDNNGLRSFVETATRYFVVDSLEFLSLFIIEGEKLRKYAEVVKSPNVNYISIDGSKLYVNYKEPFHINALKKFYDETGIREIRDMISEVEGLIKQMRSYSSEAYDAKKELFSRLQQYNPDLTI